MYSGRHSRQDNKGKKLIYKDMNIGQAKRTNALLGYHLTIFQDNLLFYGGKIIGRFVFPFVIMLLANYYLKGMDYPTGRKWYNM